MPRKSTPGFSRQRSLAFGNLGSFAGSKGAAFQPPEYRIDFLDRAQDSNRAVVQKQPAGGEKNPRGKKRWEEIGSQVRLMAHKIPTTSRLGATLARRMDRKDLIGRPEIYMSEEEIATHLGAFAGGAHAFITPWHHERINGAWGGWGMDSDRNFVAPLNEAEVLVKKAQREKGIRTLEEELGIPAGSWVEKCPDNIIYRYIITDPALLALQMARGTEGGAYRDEWIAGGKTFSRSGEAMKEAVINTIRGVDLQTNINSGVLVIKPLYLPNTPR